MAPKPKKAAAKAKAKANALVTNDPSAESPQVCAARTRSRNRVEQAAASSAPPTDATGVVAPIEPVRHGQKRKSDPASVGDASCGQTLDAMAPSSKRIKAAAAVPQHHVRPPRIDLSNNLDMSPSHGGYSDSHVSGFFLLTLSAGH
ncbi:hypothetical protein OF83DRAFT_1177318 [Amylostereum chailletii]|nr:hypothetical protein OF83DRAFT_1177318 [Amylostereum chailletii]